MAVRDQLEYVFLAEYTLRRIMNARHFLTVITFALIVMGCSGGKHGPSGRFVAVPPPTSAHGGYENFIWILDSDTGQVKCYRIFESKDNFGKFDYWGIEELPKK